jgi:acetylglutamate kinase
MNPCNPSPPAAPDLLERARTLIEALPYLQQFRGATLVIKYGGAAIAQAALRATVLRDVVLLEHVGMKPLLVHGGGPEISSLMQRLGLEPRFIEGHRVTDAETVEIAQMVLVGKTNQDLVAELNRQGGRAIGLSGKDGSLFLARKRQAEVDLGFVGEIEQVNPHLISALLADGFIPVIAPIASGSDGATYNLNADHVAGRLAAALKASKLILLTDVRGVLRSPDEPASLISELDGPLARKLIAEEKIASGMIPKVNACLEALAGGVPRCHIIDGRLPHALLMEIFTSVGIGTMVTPHSSCSPATSGQTRDH